MPSLKTIRSHTGLLVFGYTVPILLDHFGEDFAFESPSKIADIFKTYPGRD